MKLTLGLLLLLIVQGWAINSYSQKVVVNLDLKNVDIIKVLDEIEKQTDYYFLFNYEQIHSDKKIDVKLSNSKIDEVLNKILEGTGLNYSIKNWQIVISKDSSGGLNEQFFSTSVQQSHSVSGKVTDSSGAPLPGVSVVVKGTTTGVITDMDGKYILTKVPENATLQFSFVGMKTQEIKVLGKTSISIILEEETVGIEEVVAIGYGTQKKVSLTGGISQVNNEKIGSSPIASISQALQGAAPGVDVTYSNLPGEAAKIRIHGLGTINNNDPLWVIDGVPGVSTNQINPSDIESISILKDAASTAIYGSRGANGVILVTTKQGKKGQSTQVQLSSRVGFVRNSAKYDLLNVEEYGDMLWLQAKNSGVKPSHPVYGNGAEPTIPKYLLPAGANDVDLSLYNIKTYPITETNPEGTDWSDVIFNQGLTQEYNLSLSGSTQNTTYSFGIGHLDEEGIVKLSGFKRETLSGNINSKVNKWLEIGENVKLAYTNDYGSQETGETGAMGIIQQLTAILPVYDVMGNYAPVSRLNGFDPLTNPWGDMERASDYTYKTLGVNGNVYTNITIAKNLYLKSLYGFIINHATGKYPLEANPDSYQARSENQLTQSSSKGFQWNWTNTINYNITLFNRHNINALLGTEAINQESESFSATRLGYLFTTKDYWILDAGSGTQTNSGSASDWSTFSIFGRAHYDFNNKYLCDVTLRRDGSSRFGKNNRYGYFPSIGLAWRVSEENFMSGTKKWLDYFKIRTSWGQSGNDQIGNYNGFTTMGTSLAYSYYPITGSNSLPSVGFQSVAFGNADAKWERTVSKTIGIEGSLFNHMGLTLDVWRRDTKDMLYPVGIPAVMGNATVPSVNIGDMKNTGIDLQLNYHGNGINKDLSYNINLNVSHYQNEIVKISNKANEAINGSEYRSNIYTRSEVGTSFPQFYGYKVLGIFQTEEEAANYPVAFGTTYNKPGRFKFKDVNKDGLIDSNDRTYIGNPHPDFVSSLTANIKYKQFDLSVSLYASVGNDIVNIARRNLDFNMFMWNRSKRRLYESWGSPYLKDNTDAKMPMAEQNDTYSQLPSSYFVEDGSYLRLESIQLGYNLPSRMTNYLGLRNLRVYMLASNLFTITGYSGLDPQVQTSDREFGVDNGSWPTPQRFQVGINIDL